MEDYYGLAGVFASVHYKSYPLVSDEIVKDFERRQKEIEELEKEIKEFLDRQSKELAEIFTRRISDYLVASWKVLRVREVGEEEKACRIDDVARRQKLDRETLERWVKYLEKPQEEHPYLDTWAKLVPHGSATESQVRQVADDYQALMVSIVKEHEEIDEEVRVLLAKLPPKKERELPRLPNGYTSGDSFKIPDSGYALHSRLPHILWLAGPPAA